MSEQLGDNHNDSNSSVSRRATRDSVALTIGRALESEALRNESRISIVRVSAYSVVVLIDLALWALGQQSAERIPSGVACVLIASAVAVLLRGLTFRRWFRFAIPVLDAVLMGALLSMRLQFRGSVTPAFIAVLALACGVFASTGGLRFDRISAAWTALLAGVLLVYLLWPLDHSLRLLYAVNAILAIGFLNMWSTDVVRRTMQAETGRALLTRFLPGGLVERAFTDPMGLFTRPRTVEATVLISDLRGFTAMAETMEPQAVLALLSEVQGLLARLVSEHGGTVDKFMGDGMLAVFGAPDPLADHAARALACARAIRSGFAELNARTRRSLRIGVGIHSGRVVAGMLGEHERLEFTVIGDTVNIASRLESLTKERGVDVLVSEATMNLAGDRSLAPLGEVTLRGRATPLRIFTLEGLA